MEVKDIQIFFGVQVNGQKYVADKWFSIDEYNNAIDPKAYLEAALNYAMESLKEELRKDGKIYD